MTKNWTPQRNTTDSVNATVKTLLYHLQHPISKLTVDETLRNLNIRSQNDLAETLRTWGIASELTIFSSEIKNAKYPLIAWIHEKNLGVPLHIPILLFEVTATETVYVHPRKGWVYALTNELLSQIDAEILKITAIENSGEIDFTEKEKLYNDLKNNHPDRKAAVWLKNVLSTDECDYIIEMSDQLYGKSKAGGKDDVIEGRSSYSAYLVFNDNAKLNEIRERISSGLQIPDSHFEYFQCVRYEPGQEYQAHYDTFPEDTDYGREALADGGQRKFTLLIYLNDNFEGGQTYFPHLDLLATPEKGDAVLFRNLDDSGKLIKGSFHAGLPVSKGVKYALNLWIRERPTKRK